jgi:hypothetical protein
MTIDAPQMLIVSLQTPASSAGVSSLTGVSVGDGEAGADRHGGKLIHRVAARPPAPPLRSARACADAVHNVLCKAANERGDGSAVSRILARPRERVTKGDFAVLLSPSRRGVDRALRSAPIGLSSSILPTAL